MAYDTVSDNSKNIARIEPFENRLQNYSSHLRREEVIFGDAGSLFGDLRDRISEGDGPVLLGVSAAGVVHLVAAAATAPVLGQELVRLLDLHEAVLGCGTLACVLHFVGVIHAGELPPRGCYI